jgi:NAD dependent epimerase/dehydratase
MERILTGYSGRRVLVTGAGGFIGSHLCEALLASGAHVRALVRYNSLGHRGNLDMLPPDIQDAIEILAGDIRDPRLVREATRGCAMVFHLAALIGIPYSYVAPESYLDTNLCGTLNILEAAREEELSCVVQTSTSEVYGTALFIPMNEQHPLQAQSPYAASKIAADKLAESYYRSFQLPVVTVRPFNTYGPRQSARAVIPAIASQLLDGCESIQLGSLTPVRDFTYISDTVEGFLLAGQSTQAIGQVINLGNGSGISIRDLVHELMKVVGRQVAIVSDSRLERPGTSEVEQLVADATLAREILRWTPRVSLAEGLECTVKCIGNSLSNYRTSQYTI